MQSIVSYPNRRAYGKNNYRGNCSGLLIKDIIAQTGASTMKEMGKVMGIANQQMAGKADGRTISTIVKRLLS